MAAAVLRSLATKMTRAQPRLPPHHGHGLRKVSTASPPPPRGPQPHNNKDPGGSQWHMAIVGFNEAAPIAAFFLFSGYIYVHCISNPAMDRMEAKLDAQLQSLVAMTEEIKKSHERTRATLISDKESRSDRSTYF